MFSFLRLLAATLLGLFLGTGARAGTFLVDGCSVRVWQTEDGLPQNMVTAGAQTQDGYLWFGTYSGLARFDGERFEVFDSNNSPGMKDHRIARLFEDAQGTLWMGHDSGAVTRFRNGRFDPIDLQDSGLNPKIIGLGSDEAGHLWAMHENGILDSVEDGRRIPSILGEYHPAVMAWSRNPTGTIWLAENGKLAQLKNGGLIPVSLPEPQGSNYVLCLAAAADGGVWVLCDGRIRKWKDGRWAEDRGAFPWPEDRGTVACCLELRDGTLAVGTIYFGLYLIFSDGRPPIHIDVDHGLPQSWIRFLFEDREGNLWAGAGSAGLVSIHASPFSVLDAPRAARGCSVLSVASAPDGSLWIGMDGGGLYHHRDGVWTHYGPDQGISNWYIPSIAVSPRGEVWVSDFWWGGPYRLEQGKFVRPPGIEENSNPSYALLATAEAGELFAGTRDGLRHLRDGRSTWLVRPPANAVPEVCAIVRDQTGALWCGFARGGLARVVDGRVSLFRESDGLPSDAIVALCADPDGTLWIGTADRGLSRLRDGRFANLSRAQGLVDDAICAIVDDGLGYLWLSTRHGLQRIAKNELNRCADGAADLLLSHVYDRSDGLPAAEFTGGFQSVACKTPDGRLWFASSTGVIGVDPKKMESNPIPPPVVLESLHVDGKRSPALDGPTPVTLLPDHQRLEFRFSGLSFVGPSKVLFKYRLDGIDQTWIDAGTKRNAFYSRLPAGSYRFRVIACNNDGLWNTQGAAFAFTVAPFFWQTWWFVGACLLAAAVLIAWLARFVTRRRMQRRIAEIERQHEIERERSRIAQDIHDDVGASLSRIAMLSQPARADLAEPERTSALLARIYGTAREVTRALDEIVWAVDPRHDTLDSLVDYMAKFAQSYLSAAKLRCRLDLPVEVPAWPLTAETRHNLFLAFKEALNNVVKHAAASEARISFRLHADAFALSVTDNGRGFDPARHSAPQPDRVSPGHGLSNMQSRLHRIGGRCEISGTNGAGTTVTLIVAVARPRASVSPSS